MVLFRVIFSQELLETNFEFFLNSNKIPLKCDDNDLTDWQKYLHDNFIQQERWNFTNLPANARFSAPIV